jgi:ribokinase
MNRDNIPPHVAVVGSLNMDLVARAPRIPKPGETLTGSDFATHPGGKGANQAVAAARAGANVLLVGRVGDDAFGNALLSNLREAQVDVSHITRDDRAATGVALIVVEDSGQNSIVLAPGANARLTAEDVNAAEEAIASADVLLLQLEVPLATVVRAAQIAKRHGVTVILNPAPAQALPAGLLSMIDVLVPNETEAEIITGMPVQTAQDIEAAARALQQTGVPIVVMTLGAKGSLLAESNGLSRIPTFEIVPVDTTAAGDAFVGTFAVAIGEGKATTEAVTWGSAAGALAATRAGAQPSLPTRTEIMALLERNREHPGTAGC